MKKIKDENSKDKILKSAAKLFAQKGFDGVSIREICKECSKRSRIKFLTFIVNTMR